MIYPMCRKIVSSIIALAFLTIYFPRPSLFAERIILKSGQVRQGKILERADKYVTVDIEGVAVPYFNEDIERIEADSAGAAQYLSKPNLPRPQSSESEKPASNESDPSQPIFGDNASAVYNNEFLSSSSPVNYSPSFGFQEGPQSFEPQYSAGVTGSSRKQYDRDWTIGHREEELRGAVNSQLLN